jgi:hypothetical protein
MHLRSIEDERAFQWTRFPILEPGEEQCMTNQNRRSQSFVKKALSLLEERFPWLGKEDDEQISGADTVDQLTDLHRSLIEERAAGRSKRTAQVSPPAQEKSDGNLRNNDPRLQWRRIEITHPGQC